MRIDSPDPLPMTYEDYNFTFANGAMLPMTVCKEMGDEIDWDTNPMAVKFSIAPKPGMFSPEEIIPPGEVTVLMQHVIFVEHRTRVVQPPTLEQKELFQQTLHKMPRRVQ